MNTTQTISFPRELSDELGELIAEKARVCGGGAFDIWEAICEQFGTPDLRPRGNPEGKREYFEKWVMATNHPFFGFLDGRSLARGDDRTGYAYEYVQGLWVAYLEFSAEQPAPVAVALPSRREPKHYWERYGKLTVAARVSAEEWNACLGEVTRLNP